MPSFQAKRWIFVLNNYTNDEVEYVKSIEHLYLVFGFEVGESGTPHLQGFITFKKNYSLAGLKKLLPRAHWEAAKGTSHEAATYSKKDGNFYESGKTPSPGKRTDLESVAEMIKSGGTIDMVAEEHPVAFIKFGRGIRDLKMILDKPYTPEGLRGIWYWGPPGTGKSRRARLEYPEAYLKPQSKWWDGYFGQKAVILDDLDISALGHYLKIWADRYACSGETKGGTVNLQHDVIVVTSNYAIETLWKDDSEMASAVARRFKVEYMGDNSHNITN